jgi:ATP-binding cassette subfamily C (CFTR/MRP) protein 1
MQSCMDRTALVYLLGDSLIVSLFVDEQVRQSTELEVQMNGVERMRAYLGIATEAPAVIPGSRPPKAWPSAGEISVEGLVVRYRSDLPPVLQGLSFSVGAGEKVGIAGRTGCGKVRDVSILCMLGVCVPHVLHALYSG